jgi:hypothetical protein
MVVLDISIKHSTGDLEDLFGYSPNEVENESRIKAIDSTNLIFALEYFETFLDESFKVNVKDLPCSIIGDKEISRFIILSKTFESHPNYPRKLGELTSYMLQESFNVGYNDFEFDFSKISSIDKFLMSVSGLDTKPMNVFINGGLGDYCASNCNHLNLTVSGNIGLSFGFKSEHMTTYVKGNVDEYFNYHAQKSTAVIDGNTGNNFADSSEFVTAVILGEAEFEGVLAPYAKNFRGYLKREYEFDNYSSRTGSVCFSGKDAQDKPVYQLLVKEFERRFEE